MSITFQHCAAAITVAACLLCASASPGFAAGTGAGANTNADSAAKAKAQVKPLHQRIDDLIDAAAVGLPVAAPADDAEFLRRVTLDFAGVIPSAGEVRAFLDDSTPAVEKRTRLIDHLLASPSYAPRMAEAFHVHLMERRGENELWIAWLEKSFAANKPWDQMAREIIRADFRDESNRGAAFFYTRRLEKSGQNPTDYPGLTRDMGRLFLGMDLQCAECHNHRLIDDYNQVDFQGLFAAFSNVKLLREEYPAVEENLMKNKLEYASVFTQKQRFTGPRVPGSEEIEVAVFAKGEEYLQAPDRKTKTPGIPKFSPLAEFAAAIPESPKFAQNLVNRLWFLVMGRGLVEPLDQFHSNNPASHPELLDLLASEFVTHEYDIRWLLRELALTETYQRSSVLPKEATGLRSQLPADKYRVAIQRKLSAEQLLWSTIRATGHQPDGVPLETLEADPFGKPKEEDFIGLRDRFRAAFANEPKLPEREFSPSLKNAMFMMNDEQVLALLDSGPTAIVPALGAMESDARVTEELFLRLFSRLPDDEERSEIEALLGEQSGTAETRRRSIADLAWAMLSSTEFVVNH